MRRVLTVFGLAVVLGSLGCPRPAPQVQENSAEPSTFVHPTATVIPVDSAHAVVRDCKELPTLDLLSADHLDLALSPADRVGFLSDEDSPDGCQGLDLSQLAKQAPKLRSLRISGCEPAIVQGLASLDQLTALTLSEVTFDRPLVEVVAKLPRLQTLELQHVRGSEDSVRPLAPLPIRRLVLAELETDSKLAELLGLWPHSLEEVELIGTWAGHKAMLELAPALAVTSLTLVDTRVGNFSLNQIKGLSQLKTLTLIGETFNDMSPLYFRDLPVERFRCDCPRLGDAGLRALRRSTGLRVLEVPQSKVTGVGLAALEPLRKLETIVADGTDITAEGFSALASIHSLRRLELSGQINDPRLTDLGLLTSLRELRLGYPELDDRATGQLETLKNLEVLDLSHTRVSDLGLDPIASMPKLRVLKLHHTRVTHRGLEHLANLQNLEVLELDHTDLVDGGVVYLERIRSLRVLRLDDTLITDSALAHLVQLDRLEQLNLANTVVTSAGVEQLHVLPKLDVLGLRGTRAE